MHLTPCHYDFKVHVLAWYHVFPPSPPLHPQISILIVKSKLKKNMAKDQVLTLPFPFFAHVSWEPPDFVNLLDSRFYTGKLSQLFGISQVP